MRYIYQKHFTDQAGNIVASGTVTVYNASTTALATIYSSSGSTGAVSGSAVTTGTDGFFNFWVDTTDYTYTSQSKFKITLTKTGFTAKTYDDIEIIPAIEIASATTRGIVEFATDAETLTGTATDLALTPANLVARSASSTRTGIIEIATNAESLTGASTSLAITPDDLKYSLTNLNYTINEGEGAAISSSGTTNIWSTDGNTVHITGTATITSFGTAVQAGAWKKVIFDGAATLTHGANLNLPGSANIITAANDWAFVYADTTTLFRVIYFRANGTSPQHSSFSVHKNGTNQVGVVTGNWTKVTWPTEDWDTNSNFASDRFTPTIAGKYPLITNVDWVGGSMGDATEIRTAIYKNGTIYKLKREWTSAANHEQNVLVSCIVDANGTTDYFEVYVYQGSGGNEDIDGTVVNTYFQGYKLN